MPVVPNNNVRGGPIISTAKPHDTVHTALANNPVGIQGNGRPGSEALPASSPFTPTGISITRNAPMVPGQIPSFLPAKRGSKKKDANVKLKL